MPLDLNYPQNDFYHMNKPFRAFVGGYRSGKTFLGCVRLCVLALEYPGIRLGYFAPTYPQIRDIFYSTISDVAEALGMTTEIKVSTNEVTLFYYGDVHAVVKCRSMEHPARIVGFDINHALIDEIDCMKKEKADQAWKKIVARLSSSGFDEQRLYDEELDCDLIIEALGENTVDFTTTPEGFNWIYDLFVKQLRDDEELKQYYGIVNASTRQNAANLPADYIDKLYATYPANLVDAYVDGKFVNLTSGTIYTGFDRKLSNTTREWDGQEAVFIGMDFNVGQMSAVVHVKDNEGPRAVDEIVAAYDTPEMIEIIKSRYRNCTIRIYPDASGGSRKSVDASKTDLALLSQAGFSVIANKKNPFVKDRIMAMNRAFCDNNGIRSYLVNVNKCPSYADCLEQQVWGANGEPDKSQNKDHANDAGGYFIAHDYPVIKPVAVNIGFTI